MKEIVAPTNCPSCEAVLEWSNNLLYCRNPQCSAKAEKLIEHFAKNLKIKGLGPSTISKLKIDSIFDIYEMSLEDVVNRLGSQKVADKLYKEIQDSLSHSSLDVLLPAFGIPLVGKTAANKLSSLCESIEDINADTCHQAGIGPKATANLLAWIEEDFPLYKDLGFSFRFSTKPTQFTTKGVVCITGKLKSFPTKATAKLKLEEAGYVVKDSLTKDVTILLNESGVESDKTRKAKASGITISTNIIDLIGQL